MSGPLSQSRARAFTSRRGAPAFLIGQCLCIVLAWVVIALVPPSEGAMMLVPLREGVGRTVARATDHGARLLGMGIFPGSVIVVGRRDTIMPAMLAAGTLVVAAAPSFCGNLPDSSFRRST